MPRISDWLPALPGAVSARSRSSLTPCGSSSRGFHDTSATAPTTETSGIAVAHHRGAGTGAVLILEHEPNYGEYGRRTRPAGALAKRAFLAICPSPRTENKPLQQMRA